MLPDLSFIVMGAVINRLMTIGIFCSESDSYSFVAARFLGCPNNHTHMPVGAGS